MRFCCQLVLSLSILTLNACPHPSDRSKISSPELKVLARKENRKHQLTCLFYGEEVDVGTTGKVSVISQMVLRDNKTGEEVKYTPFNEVSVKDSQGYFTDVWSPGDDYLLLSAGRFEGFCIIKSGEALQSMKEKKCSDTLRVRLENETGLWHEFEKWDDPTSFTFQAGLSNHYTKFKYVIPSEELSVGNNTGTLFEGENRKGKIRVMPVQ